MTIEDYVPGPELQRWLDQHPDAGADAFDEVSDIIGRDVDAWGARHRHELVVRPSEQTDPADEDPIGSELGWLEYSVMGSIGFALIGYVEMAPRDIDLVLQGFEKPMSDN